jgi:hypothetical protein
MIEDKMNKKAMALAIGVLATSGAQLVFAQAAPATRSQYEIPTESKSDQDGPRGITLGEGVALFPFFNMSLGNDDNLFLNNTNKKSSSVQIYNPGLRLEARSQALVLGFELEGKTGRFNDSKADNYTDVIAGASADVVANSSLGFRFNLDHERGHDPRGSTDRGLSATPDEYKNSGFGFLAAYGANEAPGRVEVEAGTFRKRYQNNRLTTIASDRDGDNFAGRFFWRVAPKTWAVFEARQDDLDYNLATSLQDSKERRYFVGLTWEATAATTGTFKVGRIQKNFSAASTPDFSGTGWEGNIRWAPLSYSSFDFNTQKTFGESSGVGDFTLSKKYGVAWNHQWNSKLTTQASLSRSDDDFVRNTRDDSTDSLGFSVKYKVQRWLTLGGEYNYTDRSSSVPGFAYKRSQYFFTVGATL